MMPKVKFPLVYNIKSDLSVIYSANTDVASGLPGVPRSGAQDVGAARGRSCGLVAVRGPRRWTCRPMCCRNTGHPRFQRPRSRLRTGDRFCAAASPSPWPRLSAGRPDKLRPLSVFHCTAARSSAPPHSSVWLLSQLEDPAWSEGREARPSSPAALSTLCGSREARGDCWVLTKRHGNRGPRSHACPKPTAPGCPVPGGHGPCIVSPDRKWTWQWDFRDKRAGGGLVGEGHGFVSTEQCGDHFTRLVSSVPVGGQRVSGERVGTAE